MSGSRVHYRGQSVVFCLMTTGGGLTGNCETYFDEVDVEDGHLCTREP